VKRKPNATQRTPKPTKNLTDANTYEKNSAVLFVKQELFNIIKVKKKIKKVSLRQRFEAELGRGTCRADQNCAHQELPW
jgi:hypothetical protein